MQLTKFSDYAVRILIHLAATPQSRTTTRELAALHSLSFNHLAKVAQWLTAEGYVQAMRGRDGGLSLAVPASDILMGAVIRKSEATIPLVECFRTDKGQCALTAACGFKTILGEAQQAFFAVLDGYSLADLLALRTGIYPLVSDLVSNDQSELEGEVLP